MNINNVLEARDQFRLVNLDDIVAVISQIKSDTIPKDFIEKSLAGKLWLPYQIRFEDILSEAAAASSTYATSSDLKKLHFANSIRCGIEAGKLARKFDDAEGLSSKQMDLIRGELRAELLEQDVSLPSLKLRDKVESDQLMNKIKNKKVQTQAPRLKYPKPKHD